MVLRNAHHLSLISASFGGYWPPKGTPARGLRPRHHVGPHFVAIPGRLELPTYGLGNRRSIRLSYGTADPLCVSRYWEASYQRARVIASPPDSFFGRTEAPGSGSKDCGDRITKAKKEPSTDGSG